MHRLARSFALALAATISALIPTTFSRSTFADGVLVIDVTAPRGHEDVVPSLKLALDRELAKVSTPAGAKITASASLVSLDTRPTKDGVETKAIVSLVLRDQKGNLKLVTNGSAAIRSQKADKSQEKELVAVAARGATKGIEGALSK